MQLVSDPLFACETAGVLAQRALHPQDTQASCWGPVLPALLTSPF